MAIETKQEGNTTLVSVSGRLDGVTSPEYKKTIQQLVDAGTTRLVVDLQELNYISSVGLSELVITAKLLKENDGRLAVANVRGNVHSVFEICGIGKRLSLHNSVADAIAAIA